MTRETLLPTRRITACAGISQLINWGISFYMPGTLAGAITSQSGWSSSFIYGGLTLAMLTMAVISPLIARILASLGGQRTLIIGTLLIASGCFAIALSTSKPLWMLSWLVIGAGMRLSLYDALFAVFVSLYGQHARRSISQIALFGGLASALFWPLGSWLLTELSWREVVWVYGCAGLINAAILSMLRNKKTPFSRKRSGNRIPREERFSALLYALFIALMTFVSNGTSTHLPELISSFGFPVALGMLWGVGQTGARLLDVLTGSRLSPVSLALVISLLIPCCFWLALSAQHAPVCIIGFVFGYGAVNGLMTVVKATLPLQLFDPLNYAERTGLLLLPAQLLAAASPYVWAWLTMHTGVQGTLWFSLTLGLGIALLAIILALRIRAQQKNSELQSSIP